MSPKFAPFALRTSSPPAGRSLTGSPAPGIRGRAVKNLPIETFFVLPGRTRLLELGFDEEGGALPPGDYLALAILDYGGEAGRARRGLRLGTVATHAAAAPKSSSWNCAPAGATGGSRVSS